MYVSRTTLHFKDICYEKIYYFEALSFLPLICDLILFLLKILNDKHEFIDWRAPCLDLYLAEPLIAVNEFILDKPFEIA